MTVRVQEQDFDLGIELNQLRLASSTMGAVVCFVGLVRDMNTYNNGNTETEQASSMQSSSMTLEHYPGMTEKSLATIVQNAKKRWQIIDALIIHRVGVLQATEQIVLVAVTAAHRADAFAACEFMMDYLKTEAPFWKKEQTEQGAYWIEAKDSDNRALDKWQ